MNTLFRVVFKTMSNICDGAQKRVKGDKYSCKKKSCQIFHMTLNIPLFRSERQVIFLGLYCNALIIICALVIWKFGKVIVRNSHERCSMKKSVFKIFFQFTGKHLSQSLFFNKVAGLRFPTLFKRDPGTDVFLWILQNFSERLFL